MTDKRDPQRMDLNEKSYWIWESVEQKNNEWIMFYKTFSVNQIGTFFLDIAVDTRYFLWINDQVCVWDGGLFRDAYCKNSGFCDRVDISEFLRKGINEMKILVWHYGNGGRNNNPLPTGGLRYSCDALNLYSDETTLCQLHPGFGDTGGTQPSYLYGGFHIGFDANRIVQEKDYQKACVLSEEQFGALYLRPVPLWSFSELKLPGYEKKNQVYSVHLRTAHQVLPYMKVKACGNERIDIRSDRYEVNGGPGGGGKGLYYGHRTEYVCKPGVNIYLNYDYMACETIYFTIPESVEVLELGYRLCEYNSQLMELFSCENASVNTLIQKCANTLKICMRDNFMDCPDRERGQWIGDVSVQAPQIFYAMDKEAVSLLKKAILNFIGLRNGDVLVGNVPGIHSRELPGQSLHAIGELGMIAAYYNNTKDKELLSFCLEPMIRYLKLWEMGTDGMVVPRQGDWRWFDHLNNQDTTILENTWYYSALKFAQYSCQELNTIQYKSFLEQRLQSIQNNFEQCFWKGKYYASGECVDDRAIAMTVLTGLALPEHYDALKNVLITTYNASTYMEGYVCKALFEIGYSKYAFQRMMSRYYNLIENENSTLWEDFMILGTKNHAWTGAPLTLIYEYIAGISIDYNKKTIRINPDFSLLKRQKYSIFVEDGIVSIEAELKDGEEIIKWENHSSFAVEKGTFKNEET